MQDQQQAVGHLQPKLLLFLQTSHCSSDCSAACCPVSPRSLSAHAPSQPTQVDSEASCWQNLMHSSKFSPCALEGRHCRTPWTQCSVTTCLLRNWDSSALVWVKWKKGRLSFLPDIFSHFCSLIYQGLYDRSICGGVRNLIIACFSNTVNWC